MANLSIENMSGMIQSGDIAGMLKGGSVAQPQAPDNGMVVREMEKNGMAVSPEGVAPADGTSFGKVLEKSIDQVNQYQTEADHAVKELIAGRNKNIHETMLTLERADTSLKLMMQVRNKVLDAYKEIMKMQV